MDEPTEKQRKHHNPREGASIISILTFFYTIKTFLRDYKGEIDGNYLYETFSEHKSSLLGEEAARMWEKEVQNAKRMKKKASLLRILMKTGGREFVLIGVTLAAEIFFIQPSKALLLGALIRHYTEEGNVDTPYFYSFGIIGMSLLTCIITQPYYMASYNLGLKARVVCSCLIYNKIFRLSLPTVNRVTPGHIINLLSVDVNSFEKVGFLFNYIWIAPIQVVLVSYLIWREIGAASLLGVGFIALFVLVYAQLRTILARYRSKVSMRRDERIKLTDELIRGISVIKMYTLESFFSKIISRFRNLELDAIRKFAYIRGIFTFSQTIGAVAIFLAITSSVALNGTFDPKGVFVTVSLFLSLSTGIIIFIPSSIAAMAEIKVALKRMSTFLLCEEINLDPTLREGTSAIAIRNGYAKWDRDGNSDSLANLNLDIKVGSLTAVIGAVGSGKSSLCQVIQKELALWKGELTVNGSLSCAPQEAWIFSASIRQNIILGCEMDEIRYRNVISCCSLDTDLAQFPYGDKTIVGERGTSLSGGQKARISLARCVYREADIYLLDDPLSAVDSRVGKHIFENCIKTHLRGKTVILITHQIQYLPYVDHIVALADGIVHFHGSHVELKKLKLDFSTFVSKDEVSNYEHDEITKNVQLETNVPKQVEEAKSSGFITFSTYKQYLLSSKNYSLLIVTLIIPFITEAATSGSFYFVRHWLNVEQNLNENSLERKTYTLAYCSITMAAIVLSIVRLILFTNLTLQSSKSLHNSMFTSLLHAPLKFFHSNSSGRILNRFTKDLLLLDELLPNMCLIVIIAILDVVGLLTIICMTNSWFVIPTILLFVILFIIRRFYLATNLKILRIEAVARSPLYSYVQGTLQGLSTIRTFNVQEKLVNEFNEHLDTHSTALFVSHSVSKAFAYWIDIMSFLFITTTVLFYTFHKESYGGNIGLVLSQALRMMVLLPWGVRMLTDVENSMISVERILEYKSIEKERNFESSPKFKPQSTWPSKGSIEFKNVFLQYSKDGPFALKNLSFKVAPLQRIGIVGRTGAGKSSIISALFQLAETQGSIIIDGVDITSIGLHDLRSKLSIIPQDPVLFSGTIRRNLDPSDELNDETLWKALDDVKLNEIINNLPSGLSSLMSHDGSNLSVGQRQLLCLARAIVKQNKILILDEATANVDLETDEIIQKVIRTKFANCTVLTVAHRINTVIDSDLILVMDGGELVEFDHPHILLQNSNGTFYSMVQHTDKTTAGTLTTTAQKNYEGDA